MDRRRGGMLGLAMLAIIASAGAGDLDWLAGRWCGSNGGVFNEEVWMTPRGGTLVGMHRDTRNGRLAGFEYVLIQHQDGRWTYRAQPGGGPAVTFIADTVSNDAAEFVNSQHDFPRRVRYRLLDADTLQASVDDGSDDGKRLQWIWKRDCVAPLE